MALADTLSLKIGSATTTLPRTGSDLLTGSYKASDAGLTLTVTRTEGARVQNRVRLDHEKVVADPLQAGRSSVENMSVALQFNRPRGATVYTVAQAAEIAKGLTDLLTPALLVQILNGEH